MTPRSDASPRRSHSPPRKAKDIMIGLGYQEMVYNYLGSRREYIDNMHVDG